MSSALNTEGDPPMLKRAKDLYMEVTSQHRPPIQAAIQAATLLYLAEMECCQECFDKVEADLLVLL